MKKTIQWSKTGKPIRGAVCELAGWKTKTGKITRTGVRIAKTEWQELTPAAKRVLTAHGIVE